MIVRKKLIVLDAGLGAVLNISVMEAALICCKEHCDVEFTFNGEIFKITTSNVTDFILNVETEGNNRVNSE